MELHGEGTIEPGWLLFTGQYGPALVLSATPANPAIRSKATYRVLVMSPNSRGHHVVSESDVYAAFKPDLVAEELLR